MRRGPPSRVGQSWRPALFAVWIGAREQGRERMLVERLRAFIDKEGERADILRHQLDRTMHDRIGDEALARERRIVARRPPRAARRRKLNQPRRARSLLLRRAEQPCNQILHVKAPNEGPYRSTLPNYLEVAAPASQY